MKQNSIYFSLEELKDYLNIKTSHIRALVFKKEIPHVRVGRLLRFKKDDIDQWLENGGHNE